MHGSLVVTFASIRLPRSEVQTPARAEIRIEISASYAPEKIATGTKNGTYAGPNLGQEGRVGDLVVGCR